jgi:hypothetical protein
MEQRECQQARRDEIVKFRQPRVTDAQHLDFVRSLPCAVCGDDVSTEAAHIRSGELMYGKEHTGMAQKPHDRWTVPLCGAHHREQHSQGEFRWWKAKGVNPFTLAMTLHDISGNHEMALTAIERHRRSHADAL